MKRVFMIIGFFCVALLNLALAEVKDNVLLIPKAGEAPVIDGAMDGIWRTVVEVMAEVPDTKNTTTRENWWDTWCGFRMLWDDTNLYVWMSFNDNVINTAGGDWQYDGVELYFDGDNSKTPGDYDAVDDSQIRFNIGETTFDQINFGGIKTWGGAPTAAWEYIAVERALGWDMEVKIPLADVQLDFGANQEFGFDLQINDADESTRDLVHRWWSNDDNEWQDASLFGTAMFVDRVVTEVLDINKTPVAPTIDATMQDGEWAAATVISAEKNDTLTPISRCADWTDARQHAYLMWDDANFYLYVKVWDDVINPGGDWQNDSVELYFDADNSKTPGDYDAIDDSQVRFNVGELTYDLINFGGGKTWGGVPTEEWAYVSQPTDNGWDMELKIPLAAVQLDFGANQEFGFDLQLNDADATTRDMVLRWWSDNDLEWKDASLFGTAMLVNRATAVESKVAGKITTFKLAQNYPNPFNPRTTIHYSLKSQSQVELFIYDVMGHKIAELVNQVQSAGEYKADFEASNLASGVYIYTLKVDDGILSKKMTLLQ